MNKAFLYEMLRTESVSGGEIPLQKKVAAYMREQGAEVETDLAGDVISSINSASPFRVLLCGHIDEIGFRVTHITDDGYLQVGKAGGIRLALAQGKRVTVLGRKRLTGVMGLLLRNGEVRTDIELTDLYIDCGFTSRAEALELVAPGDFVTYSYAVDELENDCIAGRGLDNRLGAYTVLHALLRAREKGAEIVPVDSEHSAIFQSLQGSSPKELRRILLTASGGPFFGWSREALEGVTPARALQHPNWSMGAKVTIDSATLMNKGLELLEAMSLFDVPPEKIQILIHRESILHSAVEYCDNSVIAQLGDPDMRLPIQYALSWPDRTPGPARPLDLLSVGKLTFAQPDLETFRCLALAIRAAREGGTAPAILNGANEVAVERFLAGKIGFLQIPQVVEAALDTVPRAAALTLESIQAADQAARRAAARAAEG